MKRATILLLMTILFLANCKPDAPVCDNCEDETIEGTYNPTNVALTYPSHLGQPILPIDNPLTEDGIALGRRLFYDPIFSADSTMSCASCHLQEIGFTDALPQSVGIQGIPTKRSAMSLVNLVFMQKDFFWDGSAPLWKHKHFYRLKPTMN
ncbi:MAG: cytochrome-c peroxidase [Saprospiraceae bacterium]